MRVILFLQIRHLVNLAKVTLRTPKRLIPALLVVAWFGMTVIPQVMLRHEMGRHANPLPVANVNGAAITFVLMYLIGGWTITKSFSDSMLVFGMPELDFVFPSPISTRVILAFKLLQAWLRASAVVLFMLLVMGPMFALSSADFSVVGAGMAGALVCAIVICLSAAISLAAGARGGGRWWLSWLVHAVFIGTAGLLVAHASAHYRVTHSFSASILTAAELPVMSTILAPVWWAVRLAFTLPKSWLPHLIVPLAGLLSLAAFSAILALTRKENPYEPSLAISARAFAARKAMRSGNLWRARAQLGLSKGRSASSSTSIRPFGSGAMALVWKGLNVFTRTSGRFVILFFLVVGLGLAAARILAQDILTPKSVNEIAPGAILYLMWIAASLTMHGIRADIKQANILKPIPIASWKLVTALPVHGALLISVATWFVVAAVWVSYGITHNSPLILIAATIPALAYSMLSSQVWGAVLYPDWEDFSQRTIGGLIMMLMMTLSFGLPAGAGVALWLLNIPLFIVAQAVIFLCILTSIVSIAFGTAAYNNYDPSSE